MTEQEVIALQDETERRDYYLIRVGKTFRAYGSGAFALARVTGYRVVRKRRKDGNFLTVGFPERRLSQVCECITACGGELECVDATTYLLRGIDGSADDRLINGPKFTHPTAKPSPWFFEREKEELQWLKNAIMGFRISRSTPMEAMLFLSTLQQRLNGS